APRSAPTCRAEACRWWRDGICELRLPICNLETRGRQSQIHFLQSQIANRKSQIRRFPMLLAPTTPFHRRRIIKPLPPRTARVLAVYMLDTVGTLWVFDSPVTVAGEGSPCPQLRIQAA